MNYASNHDRAAMAQKQTLMPPERFSPLFNDAFLKIFGSADSAPVTQPLVNAILRAVGIPEIEKVERIVLVVAELDKVRERYNGAEGMDAVLADESLAWLYLLAAGYEHPEEVARMSENIASMEEFAQRYGIAISDPDLKRKYDMWWQSEMDYNSSMDYAKREGLEAGLREGREAGMREGLREGIERMAEGLRTAGVDEETIQKAVEAAQAE